jgi:hypothetical protein
MNISLGGVTYNLRTTWNTQAPGWMLDISDANNNPLIQGIPLVSGYDLLGQYQYMGFGFSLYVLTQGDPLAVPTYANLGGNANVFLVGP